jgi:hypothetical protein
MDGGSPLSRRPCRHRDLDRAFDHHEEVDAALAAAEQLGALRIISSVSPNGDPLELLGLSLGKVCACRS